MGRDGGEGGFFVASHSVTGAAMAASATERERWEAIRANLLGRLEELSAESKPNYAVDGERYDWGDLLGQYAREAARAEEILNSEGPFEHRSRGAT